MTSLATRWQEKRQCACDYVQQVRQQEYAVPLPNTILYLDVDIAKARQRIEQRQRFYGLKDETVGRLTQVHQAYQEIFLQKKRLGLAGIQYLKIDANKDFFQVYQTLFDYIKAKNS